MLVAKPCPPAKKRSCAPGISSANRRLWVRVRVRLRVGVGVGVRVRVRVRARVRVRVWVASRRTFAPGAISSRSPLT